MKKKLYSWHRTISIIIAIPVLLWAASGFMHPLMTNIRPAIATQGLVPVPVDSSKIKVPLQLALSQNHIGSFVSFRLVHIDTNWFYQVQREHGKEPVYLGTMNGKKLVAGDWLYAQYLAREFLEGQPKKAVKGKGSVVVSDSMPEHIAMPASGDCCDAATICVLNGVTGSKVSSVSMLTSFNSEYKSINRLLPVYNVSFERKDGIRVYVQTTQDRFAFAMDNKRRIFDRIFTLIHTWAWLDFLGKGRLVVVFLLAFMTFFTTVMGTYIFFTTKSRKIAGNGLVKARRNHRFISISIALFTLMFTFSGAFHALSELKEDTRDQYCADPHFTPADIHFNYAQLQYIAGDPITNIGIVKINNHAYWQINTKSAGMGKDSYSVPRDLMKDVNTRPAPVLYVSLDSLAVLQDGESRYARCLATQFSGHTEKEILSARMVTSFTGEYNFTDKILPVWKISYASHNHERYFVETSTGNLSKRMNDNDLIESYSFAFLHKHEFMAWGGKGLKDLSTMFWALAQIVMVSAGLILYFTRRKSKLH